MGRTEIQVIMRSAKKGYFAHGAFDGKGLTVYAGSQVSDSIRSSIKGNLSVMRSMHLDEDGRTLEDMYFKSPSAASNFVCGRSSNGWVEWVTPEGVKLSAYRDIDAGSVEAPSGATVPASSTDDEQKNGRTHKVSTETILQDLIAHDSNVRIQQAETNSSIALSHNEHKADSSQRMNGNPIHQPAEHTSKIKKCCCAPMFVLARCQRRNWISNSLRSGKLQEMLNSQT